ncbi:MAG: putative DNA binding domain-containing protein [Deltaproteobacteria bacterium]|nr:MAG: putative DNA binding domain-containing protein [Deltaproteobacteria bacterium]
MTGRPFNLKKISQLIKRGEGESLEFKKTTGELKEAFQTICSFLNSDEGGMLLFGVGPKGTVEGQEVSDKTLREISQCISRIDPYIHIPIYRIPVNGRKEVILIVAKDESNSAPFTYDGRAYKRVLSSTRRMSKELYEKNLLDRLHKKKRWENLPANGFSIKNIEREEVFRIVRIAQSVGRFNGPVGKNIGDILDRLSLREHGQLLQAAVVLFGNKFLPNYPQCELRMARFKGVDKAEFLDQRQMRGPAFKLLEEAEIFCQRHFPLPAKIVPTQLYRLEKPLIPPDAMREILVNAIIHRDYSIEGGAISLAIFDDRVEVWSAGTFPKGITPEKLSGNHASIQRNPIIAEVFNRAGLIEKWGRGTNRVISMCRSAGIAAPVFEEVGSAALVTFNVQVGVTKQSELETTAQVTAQVTAEVISQVAHFCKVPRSAKELMAKLGLRHWKTFQSNYLLPLIKAGVLERTIPDKPNSRLQKYQVHR